jgi:hypothetical protein
VTVKMFLSHAPVAVTLAACAATFGVIYLVAAFSFGAVSAEDRALLRSLFTRLYRVGPNRLGMPSTTEG